MTDLKNSEYQRLVDLAASPEWEVLKNLLRRLIDGEKAALAATDAVDPLSIGRLQGRIRAYQQVISFVEKPPKPKKE